MQILRRNWVEGGGGNILKIADYKKMENVKEYRFDESIVNFSLAAK